jgi:hypothetical protein
VLPQLAGGTEIEVTGLKKAARHNGKRGSIRSFNAASGRYIVALDTGETLALQPASVVPLTGHPTAAAAAAAPDGKAALRGPALWAAQRVGGTAVTATAGAPSASLAQSSSPPPAEVAACTVVTAAPARTVDRGALFEAVASSEGVSVAQLKAAMLRCQRSQHTEELERLKKLFAQTRADMEKQGEAAGGGGGGMAGTEGVESGAGAGAGAGAGGSGGAADAAASAPMPSQQPGARGASARFGEAVRGRCYGCG